MYSENLTRFSWPILSRNHKYNIITINENFDTANKTKILNDERDLTSAQKSTCGQLTVLRQPQFMDEISETEQKSKKV